LFAIDGGSADSSCSVVPSCRDNTGSLLIVGHASKALPEVPLSLNTALLNLTSISASSPSHSKCTQSPLLHLHATAKQIPSTSPSSSPNRHTSKLLPHRHPLHSICYHSWDSALIISSNRTLSNPIHSQPMALLTPASQ
jgi:hypothetical protein